MSDIERTMYRADMARAKELGLDFTEREEYARDQRNMRVESN